MKPHHRRRVAFSSFEIRSVLLYLNQRVITEATRHIAIEAVERLATETRRPTRIGVRRPTKTAKGTEPRKNRTMKTTTEIRFRFAQSNGVAAARKRAEVGAPESLEATMAVNLETDASLETIERAEKAGLLRIPVSGSTDPMNVARIMHDVSGQLYLPAEFYSLDAATQLERWLDLRIEHDASKREKAITEALELSIEHWLVSGFEPYLPSIVREYASDPRVVARLEEAERMGAIWRDEAHAEQLARYRGLDLAQWLDGVAKLTSTCSIDSVRYRLDDMSLLTSEEIGERLEEIRGLIAKREEAEVDAEAQVREAFIDRARTIGGEAALAVERGYDIHEAVLRDVIEQLVAGVEQKPVAVLHEDTQRYANAGWEERDSPRAEQLALEMKAEQVAETIVRPAGMTIEVGKVSRIECDGLKFTGIVVTLASPITKDRCVLFNAEDAKPEAGPNEPSRPFGVMQMSADQAWERFVGSQSPKEFLDCDGEPYDACQRYAWESPMCEELCDDERDELTEKLFEHIRLNT